MPSETMAPGTVIAVPDQQAFWDGWHEEHSVASHTRHSQDALDRFVSALPHEGGSVLEIGCGQGREARGLAARGLRVSAFDHSGVAISIAKSTAWAGGAPVDFRRHDATEPLPYRSAHFDGVFAHLSLHYFSDDRTRLLINEIARVLTPSGVLFFTVRSDRDPLHGYGARLEADMYCLRGHVRHFFSAAYARDILSDWQVRLVDYYDTRRATLNPGVFLRVLAHRPPPTPV
jgi:SAM-dependent methyltransferase